jgi:hypothetical protein
MQPAKARATEGRIVRFRTLIETSSPRRKVAATVGTLAFGTLAPREPNHYISLETMFLAVIIQYFYVSQQKNFCEKTLATRGLHRH